MSITSLTLPAFAKINLNLRVVGRRPDGYHDIDTIFQTVSLHDTLSIAALDSSEIEFSCDDRCLPVDEGNLAVRAARALQNRFAVVKGAHIRLEKRIPAQGGLGGGSSDAAVTLVALTYLWELRLTANDLIDIAANLGADVSFFLLGGTARGTGLGNDLVSWPDAPEKFLLIVKPNANVNTSDAYEALDERALTTPNSKTILSTSPCADAFDTADFASLTNDFEVVAFDLAPEISRAKAGLLRAGASAALLAGSGSAVFGIFDSEDAQRRAIQAIELEAGWRVFPCRTLGRSTYLSEMGPVGEIFARLFGR